MGFTSLLLGEGRNQKKVKLRVCLLQWDCVSCMMHQCSVLLKDKIVSRNMFDSS